VSASSVRACTASLTLIVLPHFTLAVAVPHKQAPSAYQLADSLRTFVVHMGDLLRARDANAVLGLYGDPAHFVHIENGAVVGWTDLSASMKQYFASTTVNPLHLVGEPGVQVLDHDNAVVYAVHHFDGIQGRSAHDGVWSAVLHRYASGWKIVQEHSSDRSP
jgi:ketosteroid isomerase-like protein